MDVAIQLTYNYRNNPGGAFFISKVKLTRLHRLREEPSSLCFDCEKRGSDIDRGGTPQHLSEHQSLSLLHQGFHIESFKEDQCYQDLVDLMTSLGPSSIHFSAETEQMTGTNPLLFPEDSVDFSASPEHRLFGNFCHAYAGCSHFSELRTR